MAYRRVAIADLCIQDRRLVASNSPEAKDLPFLGLDCIESVTGRILPEMLSSTNGGKGAAFMFDARHVLYGKLRPYLNKVAIPDFAGRCSTELIPLLPRQGVSRDYLAWLLRRPQSVQAAMQEHTGARMPRANMRHVLAQEVLVPDSLHEQQHLADRMKGMSALVIRMREAYQQQLCLLDAYQLRALAEFPFEQIDTANDDEGSGDSRRNG
jgi:type I restriction enzyme S subunit